MCVFFSNIMKKSESTEKPKELYSNERETIFQVTICFPRGLILTFKEMFLNESMSGLRGFPHTSSGEAKAVHCYSCMQW